jgi:ABC-type uncharacterized transport system substrate-binding protein
LDQEAAMKRREFMIFLGGAAAAWPLAARAQQNKAAVIGVLSGRSPGDIDALLAAFRKGLSDKGYVEGRNLTIDYRYAAGHYERYPAMVAGLVARRVDAIATLGGTPAARVAKNATSTIPIAFFTGGDPVADGLVASLARPGGNLTGITFQSIELMPKLLELLTELVPKASVIGLLARGATTFGIAETIKAGRAKGIEIAVVRADAPAAIDAAFGRLAALHAGGLIVGSDALLFARHAQIVALAAQYRLPAIYPEPEFAASGGLITYAADPAAAFRLLGAYVGRILKGEKPADLPVQQPTKFELVINLKTAKALGLTVPQSILAFADQVIE